MMQLSDQKLNKMIKILVIILLTLASLYILSQFNGFISAIRNTLSAVLTPFLIAFFVNFLIFPIIVFAEDKGLRPRWLIVTGLYVIIFGILGVILYEITPLISKQLVGLFTDKIPDIMKGLKVGIERLNLEENKILEDIYNKTQVGMQSYFINTALAMTTAIPSIFSAIFTIILTPIILFYFLKDHDTIGEGIYKVVPQKYKEHFVELVKRINETLGLYIRGQVIIMFGIGVFATLSYLLIELEYAVLFGIIVGLTNIIPYIGATIAAVVPVTFAILTGTGPAWYLVLSLNIGFQFIEGNILQPVIMSKQLDMHPLLILAAILGFGSLLGIIGVIFAVPIAGLVKVVILYTKEVMEKKKKEGYEV